MNTKLTQVLFFLCSIIIPNSLSADELVDTTQQSPYLHFALEDCQSFSFNQTNEDYSEFTAIAVENDDCTSLTVLNSHLYRNNPSINQHSCTPGVENSVAMCVGADDSCIYNAGSDKAIRFDIAVNPGPSGSGAISSLSFYEKAPDSFDWIDGPSGFNDYPTRYALRILANGNVLFEESDIPTSFDWTLESFDFSSNSGFTVTEETVFNFELLAYCLIGNGAQVKAWDIDEIKIMGACEALDGGVIKTEDETTICADDNMPDLIDVSLSNNTGANSAWIITDDQGAILALPVGPPFDFEGAGAGVCLIWHISYISPLQGISLGNSVFHLAGCYDLSNSIVVVRSTGEDCDSECLAEGGALESGPFEFCVGDGVVDNIGSDQIVLSGNSGTNSQWVVTDDQGNILGLPPSFGVVDFDGAGAGTCGMAFKL